MLLTLDTSDGLLEAYSFENEGVNGSGSGNSEEEGETKGGEGVDGGGVISESSDIQVDGTSIGLNGINNQLEPSIGGPQGRGTGSSRNTSATATTATTAPINQP